VNDRPLRAFLFAPGNDERKLAKLASSGSDAVVLDLEDAVADSRKEAARQTVKKALGSYGPGPAVFVRVNGVETGLLADDLAAVMDDRLEGVVIPKLEDADTLALVDDELRRLESDCGMEPGAVRVIPLVETAAGVMQVGAIAAAATDRVVTLMFGIGDFVADIGVDISTGGDELTYARSRIVVAANGCGLGAPIDGPYLLDLKDVDGLVADSRRARSLGFRGRVVVHPSHVEPVQRAFSELSPDELRRARRIVEAFESAERGGSAALRVDGRFVDYPPYHRAKEQLRLYEATRLPADPA
jgi:citrate lyase subunit beta/citryl-CoA lyase